jgi:glycosyltransferase involved in cell wall biosynthesis
LNGGGAERVAALLASSFVNAGWRTTLLVDFEAAANRDLVDPRVEMVVLGASHLTSVFALRRFLRQHAPDIAFSLLGIANLKISLARLLAGGPTRIVLSYHGHSHIGKRRLASLAYNFAPLLARQASAVVCVSDDLLEHLRDDWHVPAAKLVRIYNPVPVERAHAASADEIARRPPVIVSMGRLAAQKQFSALVEAFARVRPDARLVIFGEGPDRDDLLAQARRLNVAERLDLPGYQNDPWPCYSEGRCFALTSSTEPFGNVVVEALASGLPVVSTKSGGPEEILMHGRFGELVDSGDIEALASAIDRALDHPGDPAPRIARAREFSVDTATNAYLALFDSILKP